MRIVDDGGVTKLEVKKSTLIKLCYIKKPGQNNNELILELIELYNFIHGNSQP